MIVVTFTYPDVDFERIFSLLRPIHGIRYKSSRPIKGTIYGTADGMSECDVASIAEKVFKTCYPALHPLKGKLEIPLDIARCLGIEASEHTTIVVQKGNKQNG